jgi:hypothetical protein
MSGFVNISAAQPMRKPKKKRKHNEKKKLASVTSA